MDPCTWPNCLDRYVIQYAKGLFTGLSCFSLAELLLFQPQGYWPPNSLIELQGVPQSRTVLKAFHFNQVPAQMAENFDSELYNETIKLLGSEYNTNSIMISDVSEHFGGSSEHDLSLISKPMQGRSDGAGRLEQSFHM